MYTWTLQVPQNKFIHMFFTTYYYMYPSLKVHGRSSYTSFGFQWGYTQIIQVMDDHDLVLKQPWFYYGIPHFRFQKPAYQP